MSFFVNTAEKVIHSLAENVTVCVSLRALWRVLRLCLQSVRVRCACERVCVFVCVCVCVCVCACIMIVSQKKDDGVVRKDFLDGQQMSSGPECERPRGALATGIEGNARNGFCRQKIRSRLREGFGKV